MLFIAICLIFILCSTRKSRRRVRDEQFKENLGRYIGDVARQKKEAGAVDLDDVPDHTLPMLENSNVPQTYETSDGNDASNEASDHVSLFTIKSRQLFVYQYLRMIHCRIKKTIRNLFLKPLPS